MIVESKYGVPIVKLRDYRAFLGIDKPTAINQLRCVSHTSQITFRRYFWWENDVIRPNDDIIEAIEKWSLGNVTAADFPDE